MTNIILYLFNLHRGEEDKQKTLRDVKNNISFRGANLWILACAIIIASVGLNVNSTAVIIGAMLISPLMGPIVGSGFALGIYDFDLLKKSLLNLLIATVAGLLVSSFYFFLSPFKEAQSELLARTSPNIYDVLIAFFGGLVGVIAMTRVEKGNPIPGVAIATALMPPLCTAGYGLAIGNWRYFFGALFLYSINCVFICIATFAIVKFLNYPASKQIDLKHQKQVRYGIMSLIVMMLLPSAYFAFSLYRQQEFKQLVDTFIEKEFIEKGNTLVFKKTRYSTKPRTIELAFLRNSYSPEEIKVFNDKLPRYGLENTKLSIKYNSEDNLQALRNDILNEVNKNYLAEREKNLAAIEHAISTNAFDNKQLFEEARVIFPELTALSVSNQEFATTDSSSRAKIVLLYDAKQRLSTAEKNQLAHWLEKRLSLSDVSIVFLGNLN